MRAAKTDNIIEKNIFCFTKDLISNFLKWFLNVKY